MAEDDADELLCRMGEVIQRTWRAFEPEVSGMGKRTKKLVQALRDEAAAADDLRAARDAVRDAQRRLLDAERVGLKARDAVRQALNDLRDEVTS